MGSALVLEAMSTSLDAVANYTQSNSLAVDAQGKVKSLDAESLAAAESTAMERLVAESEKTANTAMATSESWMEAFANSEDGELRTAVAEAEDAYRHLQASKKEWK